MRDEFIMSDEVTRQENGHFIRTVKLKANMDILLFFLRQLKEFGNPTRWDRIHATFQIWADKGISVFDLWSITDYDECTILNYPYGGFNNDKRDIDDAGFEIIFDTIRSKLSGSLSSKENKQGLKGEGGR